MHLLLDRNTGLKELSQACKASCSVAVHPELISKMEASRRSFERHRDSGNVIYGTTTGYGPFVGTEIEQDKQAGEFFNHLLCGTGLDLPEPVKRLSVLCRAYTLMSGHSGVRSQTLVQFLKLLEQDSLPYVPRLGSVGASGDLVPMAYLGSFFFNQIKESGRSLDSRECLALVNGCPVSLSFLIHACIQARKLIRRASFQSAWLHASLGCDAQYLSPELHAARLHPGPREVARWMNDDLSRMQSLREDSRPFQEPYSIRTVPQILGACLDQLDNVEEICQRELVGSDDNPVITEEAVLHGGNFQGMHIAFAADQIKSVLLQTGMLIERQIALMMNPELNNDQGLHLAKDGSKGSALAGVQISATSILISMKSRATSEANGSVPTNAWNQDIVSNANLASQTAYDLLEPLTGILARHCFSLYQLDANQGKQAIKEDWMQEIGTLCEDRPLGEELNYLGRWISDNEV